ncbi:MAG: TIGR04552 family protein, partial [Myxococcales bacterium]|nr:TIGR04552 family protein [Myxococcales bacterium]
MPKAGFTSIDELSLSDLEGIRLLLRGGSAIDWHRLNFVEEEDARAFLRAQEFDLSDGADMARSQAIKSSAMAYLRRNFDFPIPKPVANKDVLGLLMLASTKGHRQLCACTILKVMHIIHHLEARELLFMLPTSDEEVFHLVEQKVYRVVGAALAEGFPIVEFIGGRKNRDSLYTKLLCKSEVSAAQIYDKLRFRIVTRQTDDVFPMLRFLMRHVFPFNFVIPGESTNTLFPFRRYCESKPHLAELLPKLQFGSGLEEDGGAAGENVFSAKSYRVVHFVVDMPVRMPAEMLHQAPPAAWALGRVIFVQVEFQVLDQQTDQDNETTEASHEAYKTRQRLAVMRRLKVGREDPAPKPKPRKRSDRPSKRSSELPTRPSSRALAKRPSGKPAAAPAPTRQSRPASRPAAAPAPTRQSRPASRPAAAPAPTR